MAQSLVIKDGNGNIKSLTVESSSYGYIPVHQITSSVSAPIYVTGAISVPQLTPVTTVSQSSVTSFTWSTAASGTFQITSSSATRKGLTVFNPGPNNLYVALSTAGDAKNGFALTNTASAPAYYSFIIYPSGTYIADQTNVNVNYGGYFISGSASLGVYVTAIS